MALWGTWEVHTEFWWGDLMDRDHLEDIGIDWKKKSILKKWDRGVDQIGLAQDRGRWRAFVNTV